jgi:hypothetical protein
MAKFLSGRENVREFSGLSTDRHLYLGLDEAEPNLGYPGEKSLILAESYYTLVTIDNGSVYDRYWVTTPPSGLSAAGISVYDEGVLVGTANSINKLNFVGRNVTASASGSISTITVLSPSVTVAETPPLEPIQGDLWWDTKVGDLRIFYVDADSNQWVDANGGTMVNPWVYTNAVDGRNGIHTTSTVGVGTTSGDSYLIVGPVGYSSEAILANGNVKINGNLSVGIVSTTDNVFIATTKSLYLGINTFYSSLSPGSSGGVDLFFGPTGIGSTTDRQYRFAWQNDRNLVLYDGGTAVWNAGTQTSDENLKDNIRPTSINPLNILNHVNVVDFEWKPTSKLYDGGVTHTGFIAQNVEDKIPNAVEDFLGTKLLHKEELIPILWKALQEAFTRIESLEKEINIIKINSKNNEKNNIP